MLFLQILFIMNGHFLQAGFIPKGNFSDLQVYGSFGKKNFMKKWPFGKKRKCSDQWPDEWTFIDLHIVEMTLWTYSLLEKWPFGIKSLRGLTRWNIDLFPITKMGGGNYRNVINGKNFKLQSNSNSFFSFITCYVKEKDEMRYSLDF